MSVRLPCCLDFFVFFFRVLFAHLLYLVTDLCSKYGCGNDTHASCSFKYANERVCRCEKGYYPKGLNASISAVTLIGSQSFSGCEEVLACKERGCANRDGQIIATCEVSLLPKLRIFKTIYNFNI